MTHLQLTAIVELRWRERAVLQLEKREIGRVVAPLEPCLERYALDADDDLLSLQSVGDSDHPGG